jgi:hypothetical protein
MGNDSLKVLETQNCDGAQPESLLDAQDVIEQVRSGLRGVAGILVSIGGRDLVPTDDELGVISDVLLEYDERLACIATATAWA